MSSNYMFYATKMEEIKLTREHNRPLRSQLAELLEFVRQCETAWTADGPHDRA
jgi:hypothetical protein